MSPTVEVILLVMSFVLSGVYSGSESALLSISVDRLKQLMEDENSSAFEFLLNKPHAVLNTILLGNNVVNIFAASLTTQIFSRHFANDALSLSVGVTTALILIFGEITPKTFARSHAEKLAIPIIRFLQINYYLMYPIVSLITYVVKKVLGTNAQLRGNIVTKQDIEYLVQKAESENSIDSKQIDLLNSILEFPKIKVKDIMIPRNQVTFIKQDASFEDVIQTVRASGHSRYPVTNGDVDKILGFLHVKDLAFVGRDKQPDFKPEDFLKPPFFIYEHMKINAVFDHMNRRKVHLALVQDENGLVVGIITLEDIMEEIFGEIVDEHDDEDDTVEGSQPEQRRDGSVLVAGTISLRDLDNTYDIEIPLNDNYSTLTGFILETLGNHFPEEGQIIFWSGYRFVIKKVEDHQIKEIQITQVSSDDDDRETSPDEDAVLDQMK